MKRVLGLCGSLRHGSYNRRLLRAAAAELPQGTALELFERLADVPPYHEDRDAPSVVNVLRSSIREAGAVLIATPEYNASIPGQLKNALDWASRPFPDNALRDKPVAVVGASTGLFGAVWAQAELRKVLTTIGAQVIDIELPVALAQQAFTQTGRLADRRLQEALSDIVQQLIDPFGTSTTAQSA